jgi:hypothetical protein
MGWIAFTTSHAYLPLAVLGVFYGTMLSYPATKLLSPRLQSALGGLLGGISLGNISNRIATGESAIRSLSRFITTTVQQVFTNLPEIAKKSLEDGVVLCIWMAIVTMFLFIATNAYLGEGSTAAKTAVAPVTPNAQAPATAAVPTNNAIGMASGSQN